jgi:hypothetical protein
MSIEWAKGLPWWAPYREAGINYDLSHLHPFRYHMVLEAKSNQPSRVAEIRVAFESHTFTVGCLMAEVPHIQYSANPHDLRRFCPTRYELSKMLPDIIRNLRSRRCYFALRNNFFVVELPGGRPPNTEYWVFFDVRPSEDAGAVVVRVQSAYIGDKAKPPSGRTAKKVGFAVLVSKALSGERARPPP